MSDLCYQGLSVRLCLSLVQQVLVERYHEATSAQGCYEEMGRVLFVDLCYQGLRLCLSLVQQVLVDWRHDMIQGQDCYRRWPYRVAHRIIMNITVIHAA